MFHVLRYSAFTATPTGGNPAGIVLDATGLDDATMLGIAAEVGYSETAFVFPHDDGETLGLRYFSPLTEVAFCGHATIATSVAIAERDGTGRLAFETQAGEIVVETVQAADGVVATLTSAPTRSSPVDDADLDAALAAIGWTRDELDPQLPPHVAHAGNDHLVVAAATRARLAALDYELDALGAVMDARGWVTLQLVFAERPDLFHARNPFPPGGVFEDPATGSAAAALGGYLRVLGRVPDPPHVTVLQGEDMGRPSRLEVEIPPAGGVRVSGRAVAIPA